MYHDCDCEICDRLVIVVTVMHNIILFHFTKFKIRRREINEKK